MRPAIMEVLAGIAWILFRSEAESRELEQNLRAVRWTIGTSHLLGTVPSVVAGVMAGAAGRDYDQLAASGGILLLVCVSLFFCVRGYRKLAAALRDELVREVMES